MTRAGSASWAEATTMFAKPRKIFVFYMLGVSIAAFVNMRRLEHTGLSNKQFILHKRLSENEQTHGLLKILNKHIATRKMGVFEANP